MKVIAVISILFMIHRSFGCDLYFAVVGRKAVDTAMEVK